ncbi:MAG: DUF2178 domain-containing protein [Clostridia bacterium]|nr:DUF2178 domain-containing protein [Clostridia bacterium]
MEENQNKTEELAEDINAEVAQPTREEILAMSREENKNGDERKKNIYKTASSLAFRIGIIIAIILSAVNLIVNKNDYKLLPMYCVVFGMVAADSIYIGKKEKKKGLFVCGIIMAVMSAVLTVLSILGLCGVIGLF